MRSVNPEGFFGRAEVEMARIIIKEQDTGSAILNAAFLGWFPKHRASQSQTALHLIKNALFVATHDKQPIEVFRRQIPRGDGFVTGKLTVDPNNIGEVEFLITKFEQIKSVKANRLVGLLDSLPYEVKGEKDV